MLSKQQKGKLFEELIKEILFCCGFSSVIPDGNIVYTASPGVMVHGLGQSHNADVLVYPPFQIPFFFPSRLLVECKGYDKPVDLKILRNALGLRLDINNFEIVTPLILSQRRNYRRVVPAVTPMQRYYYQVAVASLHGFKKPAEEFASVHKIPLISLKDFPHSDDIKAILESTRLSESQAWEKMKEKILDIRNNFTVGVLDSGDIFFLYDEHGNSEWMFQEFGQQVEIHWAENRKLWRLSSVGGNSNYAWFELPDTIFEIWAQQEFDRDLALDLKDAFLKNIYVMRKIADRKQLNVLHVSRQFLDAARRDLKSDNN